MTEKVSKATKCVLSHPLAKIDESANVNGLKRYENDRKQTEKNNGLNTKGNEDRRNDLSSEGSLKSCKIHE